VKYRQTEDFLHNAEKRGALDEESVCTLGAWPNGRDRPGAPPVDKMGWMDSAGHRVLLVDDNADSVEPLSLLLEARGHQTRIATGGAEAILLAEEFQPQCVVLDLGLPLMDGYEVARRLREQPNGREVVLVALTGWAGRDVRTKAAEAGFDYHLVKPVNWDELEQIIQSRSRSSLT
jgi:CheY-like chemotaxis protein